MKYCSRAETLIKTLKLKPHPEGGFYREMYRSARKVIAPQGKRSFLTQIYFLLRNGEISRWHQVLSDESWNFIEGAPLSLYQLDSSLKKYTPIQLGLLIQKQTPFHVVQAKSWQAAESTGAYSLVTCLVSPGFDFQDFRFLSPYQALKVKPNLKKFI